MPAEPGPNPNPAAQAGAPGLSDAQTLVLQQAESARVAASGKPYTWGGTDTSGFDCSGFVIHVFNQAYGTNTLARVSADTLRTGGRFLVVTDRQSADLVFFKASATGTVATHVGIVVDAERWIGSQSSTGVAYVKFTNSYWKPRILAYGRYQPLQVANAIVPMRAGSFASRIRTAGAPAARRG